MVARRQASTTKLAAAATLAWSAAVASAGVVEAGRQPPLAGDAEPAIISSPTTFNLGLSSAAGLRVTWPHAAAGVGVGVDDVRLPAAAVHEPASASLALAVLAVLGALLARRRAEV